MNDCCTNLPNYMYMCDICVFVCTVRVGMLCVLVCVSVCVGVCLCMCLCVLCVHVLVCLYVVWHALVYVGMCVCVLVSVLCTVHWYVYYYVVWCACVCACFISHANIRLEIRNACYYYQGYSYIDMPNLIFTHLYPLTVDSITN